MNAYILISISYILQKGEMITSPARSSFADQKGRAADALPARDYIEE